MARFLRRRPAVTGPVVGRAAVAERIIEGYLFTVSARLAGPKRARRDILAELRAGLADAADAYRAAGLGFTESARAAVAEFGEPQRVADGFRHELTAARARRTVLPLVTAGPVIGGLWVLTAVTSDVGRNLTGLPAGARPVLHLAAIALAVAIIGALVTLATTGRLGHRLPARPLVTAAIAAGGTVPIDLTLLTLLAFQTASAPGHLAVLPAVTAAAASTARLAFTGRATWRCLTTPA